MLYALGIFSYPFIKLVNDVDKDFSPYQRKSVLRQKINGLDSFITEDGLIGVVVSNQKEALENINLIFGVLENINLIFGVMLLHQIQVTLGVKNDLIQLTVNGNGSVVLNATPMGNNRNAVALERDTYPKVCRGKSNFDRPLIKLRLMKKIFSKADYVSNNKEFIRDILLLVEAQAMRSSLSNSASFLLSWIIIENTIEKEWNNLIASLNRNSDQKKDLRNTRSWTAYNKIEMLNIKSLILDADYERLFKLRKIRNDIVHNEYSPTDDETYKCLLASHRILSRIMLNKKRLLKKLG